jgi:hypothetical protein
VNIWPVMGAAPVKRRAAPPGAFEAIVPIFAPLAAGGPLRSGVAPIAAIEGIIPPPIGSPAICLCNLIGVSAEGLNFSCALIGFIAHRLWSLNTGIRDFDDFATLVLHAFSIKEAG